MKSSPSLPTPNLHALKKATDGRVSARDMAERGTTLQWVKGPKSRLNVKLNGVQRLRQ